MDPTGPHLAQDSFCGGVVRDGHHQTDQVPPRDSHHVLEDREAGRALGPVCGGEVNESRRFQNAVVYLPAERHHHRELVQGCGRKDLLLVKREHWQFGCVDHSGRYCARHVFALQNLGHFTSKLAQCGIDPRAVPRLTGHGQRTSRGRREAPSPHPGPVVRHQDGG